MRYFLVFLFALALGYAAFVYAINNIFSGRYM